MKLLPNIIKFDGLGTHWECEILGDIGQTETDLLSKKLTSELDRFSKSYSRFDDNSLIVKLNTESKIVNPPKEMVDMFRFARDMYEVSEGMFNISVGGKLHSLGYGKVKLSAPIKLDFWKYAEICDSLISMPEDSVVDLGGFGKGWLIDNFVKILRDSKVDCFVVNGGGDLYVQSDEPIEIALEHPFDPSKKIGQTRISQGALAASSTLKRVWLRDGDLCNHIIDPISGQSSDSSVVGTFVRADNALIADTMATILLIKPELNNVLKEKFNLKTILLDESQFKN